MTVRNTLTGQVEEVPVNIALHGDAAKALKSGAPFLDPITFYICCKFLNELLFCKSFCHISSLIVELNACHESLDAIGRVIG